MSSESILSSEETLTRTSRAIVEFDSVRADLTSARNHACRKLLLHVLHAPKPSRLLDDGERWDDRADEVEDAIIGLLVAGISDFHVEPLLAGCPLPRGMSSRAAVAKIRSKYRSATARAVSVGKLVRPQRNSVPGLWSAIAFQCLLVNNCFSGPSAEARRGGAAAATCFMHLIKGLNHVQPPDWRCGSVRAHESAPPSAFMTYQSTRALRMLSDRLSATKTIVETVRRLKDRCRALRALRAAPRVWQRLELTHAIRLCLIRLCPVAGSSLTLLPAHELQRWHADVGTSSADLWKLAEEMRRSLEGAVLRALRNMRRALWSAKQELDRRQARILGGIVGNLNQERAVLAHAAAREAADYGLRTLERVSAMNIEACLDALIGGIGRALLPASTYLDSVLDRQLALGDTAFDAAELAFSAAGLLGVRGADDDRLREATLRLQKHIVERDKLRIVQAFQAQPSGYALRPVSSEVLRAFAQLVAKVAVPLDPAPFRKIVAYFKAREVCAYVGGKSHGWSTDNRRQPPHASRWATAIGVQAITSIVGAIDRIINRAAETVFATTSTERTLDDYVWPDHGMVGLHMEDLKKKVVFAQSAATGKRFLGQLAADFACHANEDARSLLRPSVFSSVLYGPPGTGKTTFVQAIAKQSQVPCFVVTPSDLIVGGSDMMEWRARVVFRVLQCLKNCVVMMDEFDPVLLRRDSGKAISDPGQRTVFACLTESMLPKLTDLYARARDNGVAYVLLTNRVGALDDAAIRDGRFDVRMGVYRPDAISRAGYLASQRPRASGRKVADAAVATAGMSSTEVKRNAQAALDNEIAPKVYDDSGPHESLKYTGEGTYMLRERADIQWMNEAEKRFAVVAVTKGTAMLCGMRLGATSGVPLLTTFEMQIS